MSSPLILQETIKKYAIHAKNYDSSAERTMYIRRKTIEKLSLKPGDIVLDVACGTGLSFPLIREAIGTNGKIIGIEVSPDMAYIAKKKVNDNNWDNIEILVNAVENANIPKQINAVLFKYTHDVIQSLPALQNIFKNILDGSNIAMSGMKLISGWKSIFNW